MEITFYDWMTANPDKLGTGGGLFSPLHIALIVAFFAVLVAVGLLSRRFPDAFKKVVFVLCVVMIVSRSFRMVLEVCVGAKTIAEALPFHLCHIMAFVIPITYFCRARKVYHCVLFYGFIGGMFTFLFGDYYQYSVLTFYDVESILLHVMLASVAVSQFVRGQIRLTPSNAWQIHAFLLVLVCWAELGNTLLGTNFMFIRENGLPFQLFPGHYLWTYIFFYILSAAIVYAPFVVKYLRARHHAHAESQAVPPVLTVETAQRQSALSLLFQESAVQTPSAPTEAAANTRHAMAESAATKDAELKK